MILQSINFKTLRSQIWLQVLRGQIQKLTLRGYGLKILRGWGL